MKARGVYVYGVWCPDCGWWTGFNPDKEVVKGSIREFHPCFTHHDAKIKRVYIAPPKGKKP